MRQSTGQGDGQGVSTEKRHSDPRACKRMMGCFSSGSWDQDKKGRKKWEELAGKERRTESG